MVKRQRSRSGEPRVRVIPYKDRPYGLRWMRPDGTTREITSGTTKLRDAQRAAAELELDLVVNNPDSPRISWAVFRERYEQEKLLGMSDGSQAGFRTAANQLERLMAPRQLSDVGKSMLSRWAAKLRDSGLASASVRSYLAAIHAALGWAEEVELIDRAPRVKMPRKSGSRAMRSRPINAEEFERILMAARRVRPQDYEEWVRFLQGLYHSGLRVDELRRLRWDRDADLSIDTTQALPLIRLLVEGHKSRRDEYQPITPEFWELIECPPPSRQGYVFPFSCRRKGDQITRLACIRIVNDIGRAAGVITDARSGKCATSHDIGRRAFLTRMDGELSMAELQKWARHSSTATTMTYYHHRTALELGRKVWGDQPLQIR